MLCIFEFETLNLVESFKNVIAKYVFHNFVYQIFAREKRKLSLSVKRLLSSLLYIFRYKWGSLRFISLVDIASEEISPINLWKYLTAVKF